MNSLININHISNYDFHTLASHGIMVQDPTKLMNMRNPFYNDDQLFDETFSKTRFIKEMKENLTKVFVNSDMTKEQYICTYNLINSNLDEDNTLAEEILKTYE